MVMDVFNLCLTFLVLLGHIVFKTNKCYEVKDICACSSNRKNCTCTGLQYIPRLPAKTTDLKLDSNYFPHLRRGTFRNVSSIHLMHLILKNNSIERIDCDVFTDLKFLRSLAITYEEHVNINDLKLSFRSLNFQTFESLSLENNKWSMLPHDIFDYLNESKYISTVSLRYNKLQKLNSSLFIPLSGLMDLYCAENSIAYVYAQGMRTVEYLGLSDNNIYLVPKFCDNTGKTLVPRLKTLFLINNAIRDLTIESFKCLDSLKHLILDGNRMKRLGNNIFATLQNLRNLSISHISQLSIISDRAFNSSPLQKLRFSHNNYRFDRNKHYNHTKVFNLLPNLTVLDLSKNYLPRNDSAILEMLGNLIHLRTLHLDTTNIHTIPARLLQNMPKLTELILIGNKISRLDASIFVNMTSLKRLDIAGNRLHVINKTSFPPGLLGALETINMADNPFWCTCDQIWFINMLKTANITKKIIGWPKYYTCDYPENFRDMLLSKYNPNDDECSPWNILSIIIILVSSTTIFVFFGVIVLLKCQVNIRNALYFVRVFRRIKQGYVKLETSEDFEYDAFVVYCDADRQWVHGVLLNKLESMNLKICVHHRDFDVGEPITNNIEKYVNKSWKVIVVMSNNFAKSEWCQWELDLVQERRRRQGKEAIVLIMYRQIDARHMTSPLRTLLDTTPHLTFKEGFGEQLFWKTVIRDVNKSLNYPPAALF